jgi:transcriptional regulator with XRE-family HTH domain
MPFNEKLRAARRTMGMTQADVARELPADQSDVSRWERGETMPQLDRLVRLGRLYRVPLDWLLNEERAEPAGLARELFGHVEELGYAEIRRRILNAIPTGGIIRFEPEPEPPPKKKNGKPPK